MNDWVSHTRSKFVLSSVAISSPIVPTQQVPNSQSPGSILAIPRLNTYQKHSHHRLKRMSDMSDSTMGIDLSGESVKRILFALLTV